MNFTNTQHATLLDNFSFFISLLLSNQFMVLHEENSLWFIFKFFLLNKATVTEKNLQTILQSHRHLSSRMGLWYFWNLSSADLLHKHSSSLSSKQDWFYLVFIKTLSCLLKWRAKPTDGRPRGKGWW